MSIAIEEADESFYWLDLIKDKGISCDKIELEFLLNESDEITRILSSARHTVSKK